jgi:hypothetical protein
MAEAGPEPFTARQTALLEQLLRAGFTFITFEYYARYVGVRKENFVALLEPAEGRFRVFSQAGLLIEDGIGMLVERGGRQVFVWKEHTVPATPELLEAYERFRSELHRFLASES